VQRCPDGDALHPDDLHLQRARPLLAVWLDTLSHRLLLTGYNNNINNDNNNNNNGEERASLFLFQRLSVSLQRFNSVLLHETFVIDDVPGQ